MYSAAAVWGRAHVRRLEREIKACEEWMKVWIRVFEPGAIESERNEVAF